MNHHEQQESERLIVKIERSFLAIIMVAILTIIYAQCQGQVLQQQRTIEIKDKTLKQTVRILEQLYPVKFVYSRNRLDVDRRISISGTMRLDSMLSAILIPMHIRWELLSFNSYIVLSQPKRSIEVANVAHKEDRRKRKQIKRSIMQTQVIKHPKPGWHWVLAKDKPGIVHSFDDYEYLQGY